MTGIPNSLSRYAKFISFVIKYWNSDVMRSAADNALNVITAEEKEVKGEQYEKPEELVADLKAMGPTYVKLGQLLSTRPDFLPDEYLEALATLQDDVASVPYSEVKQIIEAELGARINQIFSSFDQEPIASASIGQVHKAILPSGRVVAVKIQRPGIRQEFIEDLNTLSEIMNFAVKYNKDARRYGVDEILEELKHTLLHELDCLREAQNLKLMSKNLASYEQIIIPLPVDDYTTSRILTMDYIEGRKITSIDRLRKLETDFTPLIEEFASAYLQQIIVDGFAHADPHPGNVYLTADNKIALLDLGMVAKFSRNMQESLLKLMSSMSQRNGDQIAQILLEISQYGKDADLEGFKKKINRQVLDTQSALAKDMQTGRSLIQMNRIAAEHGIRIAVELNILGKILLNLDQIVAVLTPDFDLQKCIERNIQQLMTQKMLNELKPENLLSSIVDSKRLTQNLPDRLNKITEKLANDEFSIRVDAINEKRFTDAFQKVANRITIGLIIAALILGAAMLMRVPTSFTIMGYPGLAMLLFLCSAVIGMFLVFSILKNDEDFKRKK